MKVLFLFLFVFVFIYLYLRKIMSALYSILSSYPIRN